MQTVYLGAMDTSPPRAVSVVLNVTEDGRIIIPAEALSELGVREPQGVSASIIEGELVVDTLDAAVRRMQAYYRQFIPADVSLVDELIAERRAEAARE
jgi:bifunctional DNA-binding transcriptional regulator/antitoxin component of YhaV-PrlF toxin-antitoxin module